MTYSAHIQTALEAACKFGRKQYDHANHDCSRALLALAEMNQPRTPRREQTAATMVIGGGNSLKGRIKWLLENNGPMTRKDIQAALGLTMSIRGVVATLHYQKVVDIKGRADAAVVSIRKAVVA